jgi:hypothetical protein
MPDYDAAIEALKVKIESEKEVEEKKLEL